MKADFICVYDLIEHNIKNVKHKELIENKVLVPADEWAEFLEEYSDVINALINKSSVFINTIAEVPYAYNNYSNCFSAVATCLYQRMREEAIIAKSVETISNLTFSIFIVLNNSSNQAKMVNFQIQQPRLRNS